MNIPLYDVSVSNSVKDDGHKHVNNGDAVYASCLCGAKKCKGFMFK